MFLRTFQGLTQGGKLLATSQLTMLAGKIDVIVHFGNNLLLISQNRLTTLLSKQNCKFNANISTLNKVIPPPQSVPLRPTRSPRLMFYTELHYTIKAHCLALKFARRPASWVF